MNATQEEWRTVIGHVGYEVSNLGNVRSWRSPGLTKALAAQPRVLRLTPAVGGRYHLVTLAEPRMKRYVHHLVADAFIGRRPDGMVVAHYDGNGLNNRVENLRYATDVENMSDKLRHGTDNRGERSASRKLTAAQVAEIRRRYGPYRKHHAGWETQRGLAEEFGVNWQQIGRIIRGEVWCDEDQCAA